MKTRGVQMWIFLRPLLHHCVCIPANSRTFQVLEILQKKFPDFPGGVGTLASINLEEHTDGCLSAAMVDNHCSVIH